MKWKDRVWIVLSAIYVALAMWIVWEHSEFPREQAAYEAACAVERQELAAQLRPQLPEYEAKVKEIKARLDNEGFTNFAQYQRDREWLIILRDRLEVAGGSREQPRGPLGPEDNLPPWSDEYMPLWQQAHQTVHQLVGLMHAERALDMERTRTREGADACVREGPYKWNDVNGSGGLHTTFGSDPYIQLFSYKADHPTSSFWLMLLGLYAALMPLGLFYQIRTIAAEGYSVGRLVVSQPSAILFFCACWPWVFSKFEPRKLIIRRREAWLKRVQNVLGSERLRQVRSFLYEHAECTLEEMKNRFDDVAYLIERRQSSRLQRVMVAASVILFLFRPTQRAQAQEPVQAVSQADPAEGDSVAPVITMSDTNASETVTTVSDTLTVRYVAGESAVEVGSVDGWDNPIRLSWRNTFAKFVGRARFVDDQDDVGSTKLAMVQPRLRVISGPWSAYMQVSFINNGQASTVRLDQANLTWTTNVFGHRTAIRLGREFLPTLSGIPPPFGGMFDGALTDNAFSFLGDGLSVSTEVLEGLTATAKLYTPISVGGLPDHAIFGLNYLLTEDLSLGFMSQVGPDPDEEWLVGGELTGKLGPVYAEFLGVACERPGGQLMYGTHTYLSYQLTGRWGVAAQFDWLNTEASAGSDRIERHYRLTGGVWFDPASILRLQVEVAGDWLRPASDGAGLRGANHQQAVEFIVGAIARF